MFQWLVSFLALLLKDPRVPALLATNLVVIAAAAGGHLDESTAKWIVEMSLAALGGLISRHRGLQDPVDIVQKTKDTEGD